MYRSLFIAQLVSNIGGWMQTVGAQWFLVEREASTTVIAAVQTASLLPTLLLALLAGALANALDRRVLLIVVGFASMLTAGILTALAWTDTLSPWGLLACTFVLGCWSSLSAPAWQAIQPELVPREQIPAASALGGVTVNGARAIGPALAGVLVAVAGPTFVFAINVVSFLATLGVLIAWKRPRDVVVDREGWQSRSSPGCATSDPVR
ncbi:MULTISPECIES: MFS transporter [unclassified Rhodococcus (in: high G+C Gram-positive bacteria)]|uniref:MFS transporter n=1 Tax=unclassified Rhodococcus (in: high G+C Gram-positive bacteria) TaxID=192944 RepID=UPI0020CE1608|nr:MULTISPECIES: MFS transporter [unclassified Rhodococcus (in: high G+C Gram-positive bacteria)]